MKANFNVLLIAITSLILTSCFSTYPIQTKFPCEETTTQHKLEIIDVSLKSKMKPKKMEVKEDGVTYNKNSFKFSEVRFVRVRKKAGKYFIQVREINGEMNEIPMPNKEIMEKVNNALMCLTDLHKTNGRPRKPDTNPVPNKYDQLEKLKKLLESGAITSEEYEKEKKKILEENN